MLSARAAVEASASEEDDEPSRGAPLGPVGVGARSERVRVGGVCRVANAEMLGPDEIHEHANEAHVQSLGGK
eukprot:6704477-Prymnesium_polylepis.1